ncbi:MAG: phosphoribosylglycinamide formyltransferase [Ignavibacteriales bacterium]|nr:phosphoribosylglycinamide formyltransferase [Ignavibacteriales bacterium]
MRKVNFALFISGRGSNMEAILRNCLSGELGNVCEPRIVLSNNAEAAGLHTAESLGFETVVVVSKGTSREVFEREVLSILLAKNVEYIVLAGFNRIISPFLLHHFPNKIINIHPADTKAYQGLHGYAWAFEQKLPVTKVTVHYVDEGIDTGNIIMQEEVDLQGAVSLEEVMARGLRVEHALYSRALTKVFSESI